MKAIFAAFPGEMLGKGRFEDVTCWENEKLIAGPKKETQMSVLLSVKSIDLKDSVWKE